jgi:homoserine dehydrogenase
MGGFEKMIQVAILGYGIVGSGVAEVLNNSAAMIEVRRGIALSVKSILDIRAFEGDPFEDCFVSSFEEIEKDPAIKIVVETIGGVEAAYHFTRRALVAGKHVVTSNKELIAEHGPELLSLARQNQLNYLFEASVGGGIPIIRPLTQCLSVNRVYSITGILNGTCNYILTRMKNKGSTFNEALREAQALGYAEADPTDDVMGFDTARKIGILASLVVGRRISPTNIQTIGISGIQPKHLEEADENGYAVKLLGRAQMNAGEHPPLIYVEPHLVAQGHPFYGVEDEFNAVLVSGDVVGDVLFQGKGAGKYPTASAIVSDIVACVRSNDHMKGLVWYEIPVPVASPAAPESGLSYQFSDGSYMRVLR